MDYHDFYGEAVMTVFGVRAFLTMCFMLSIGVIGVIFWMAVGVIGDIWRQRYLVLWRRVARLGFFVGLASVSLAGIAMGAWGVWHLWM